MVTLEFKVTRIDDAKVEDVYGKRIGLTRTEGSGDMEIILTDNEDYEQFSLDDICKVVITEG